MIGISRLLAAATILVAALSGSATADPHKNESGKGKGKPEWVDGDRTSKSKGKVEWQSGDCKYERKWDAKGYKEEYKCGRPARYSGGPPPWAPAHGYRRHYAGEHRDLGLSAPPLDLGSGRCNREIIGQLLGGVAGAAAGSQIGDGKGRLAAIAVGTIAGVLIGGEIGRGMDRADGLCVDQALELAPDGGTIAWNHGGRQYEVVPRQSFQAPDGRYCREYQASSTVGGQPAQTFGIACRQPDGAWRIVN